MGHIVVLVATCIKPALTAVLGRATLHGMYPAATPAFRRAMIAPVVAFVFALQALLATWAPTAEISPHHDFHHAAEHHSLPHDALPGGSPSNGFDHHAKLCCILGSKLGTAIGPTPAIVFLLHPTAADAASVRPATEFHELFRPPLRPLGARAPPLAI
jgi:hypothetical protein